MTDFQREAVEQGRKFEEVIGGILEVSKAAILETRWKDPYTREEVDFVADTENGVRFWVEAKGSWKSKPPGLMRADTTKKAVGVAWHLHHIHGSNRPPYILVTTDLPKPNSVSELEVEHALEVGLFTAVISVDDLRKTVKALDDGKLP